MQTRFCRVCFKPINFENFCCIFASKSCICKSCFNNLVPVWKTFCLKNIKCEAIFNYEGIVKDLIYQYKKFEDIELAPIFLSNFKMLLNAKYFGYIIVPIPSHEEENIKRGYNHVIEMFKVLDLPIKKVLIKTKKIKQKEFKYDERSQIINYLKVDESIDIRNKKVLIVDDVMTTGSSIKAAIELLSKYSPKVIKVLVVAKNPFAF